MFEKLSDSEKKVLIAWIILGIILLIAVATIKITQKNIDDKYKYINSPYKLVLNHDRYYTVSAALSKFYAYINEDNYQSVVNILDSKYKQDNNITKDNVNNFIKFYDVASNYETKVMCSKEIAKGIFSYLVSGNDIGMNNGKRLASPYYQVVLDGNKLLFSVKPISKEDYEEKCHE